MAKSVRDAALLLEAIAGPDGIDDRQPPYLPPGTLDYTLQLDSFLSSSSDKPLAGTKVGMLKEGFTIPNMDPNISSLCTAAVSKLKDLGASVTEISIPSHTNAAVVWMCSMPIAGGRQGLLSDMSGRKQLYMTDRVIKSGRKLSQEAFSSLSPGGQNLYMRYLYLDEKHGPELHAKCSNLLRKITVRPQSLDHRVRKSYGTDCIQDDYNRALKEVDVLVMPTLPSPPCRLFDDPSAHGPLERLSRNVGLVGNTAPFNSTGHPALSIPVGFVPAHDDAKAKLPAGLQIVGKKFGDGECLKVGAAWERAVDWKTFVA